MTTALGSWANDSGGGTPILAADLNIRDTLLKGAGLGGLIPPSSPNAKDDEFDGTSSVTWSNTPTAATTATIDTTVAGALYVQHLSGTTMGGKVQAVPASYPFTITTRVRFATLQSNFQLAEILVAPASPTTTSVSHGLAVVAISGVFTLQRLTSTLSLGSQTASTGVQVPAPPLYLRLVFASAASMTSQYSMDGLTWITHESGFTTAITPGVMGLICTGNGAGGMTAAFDFFRVT